MESLISGTGNYTGTSAPEEEGCFQTERCCLNDLLKELETPCLFYRYFLFDYRMLTTVICLFCCSNFLSGSTYQYKLPDNVSTNPNSRGSLWRHTCIEYQI